MRFEIATGYISTQVRQSHSVLEVGGCLVPVDRDGYLINHVDWTWPVAEYMANNDGIRLDDDHWLLIYFLSHFYRVYEVAPSLAILSQNLCKGQKNCRWTRAYIKQLFPEGARMACRYAGLPKPVKGSCV